MTRLVYAFILFTFYFLSFNAIAHGSVGAGSAEENQERTIVFPDTKQFKTVITDLHTHSVFSDGHVWPNIRVSEALWDVIDALAIT